MCANGRGLLAISPQLRGVRTLMFAFQARNKNARGSPAGADASAPAVPGSYMPFVAALFPVASVVSVSAPAVLRLLLPVAFMSAEPALRSAPAFKSVASLALLRSGHMGHKACPKTWVTTVPNGFAAICARSCAPAEDEACWNRLRRSSRAMTKAHWAWSAGQ